MESTGKSVNPELLRLVTSRSKEGRVLGTHLYPIRLIGDWPELSDPYYLTEVVATVTVDSHQVYITRSSGVFVKIPEDFLDIYSTSGIEIETDSILNEKAKFQIEATRLFNQIICELTLHEIISEPASPIHISYGQMQNGHALVLIGSSGRESYLERTFSPSLSLLTQSSSLQQLDRLSEDSIIRITPMSYNKILRAVSPELPTLIAAAYSLFSRLMLSEALIDSWIVCEQILDYWWSSYLKKLPEQRRPALKDTRTYSAAVRTEVLFTAGEISEAIYTSLNTTRKERNALAHRAVVTLEGASAGMKTLKLLLDTVCQKEVAHPQGTPSLTW